MTSSNMCIRAYGAERGNDVLALICWREERERSDRLTSLRSYGATAWRASEQSSFHAPSFLRALGLGNCVDAIRVQEYIPVQRYRCVQHLLMEGIS